MSDRVGFTVDFSKPVEIELPGGATVEGAIVEVSRYAICLRYAVEGRVRTHWFHTTGRRMGDNDSPPLRFVDRLGAITLLP